MSEKRELAEFFAARLDEDRAAALNAGSGEWYEELRESNFSNASLKHAGRHDPARVLADVEADRAILAMYEAQTGHRLPEEVAVRDVLGEVVRVRAARFSSHPDYRKDEWAPCPS